MKITAEVEHTRQLIRSCGAIGIIQCIIDLRQEQSAAYQSAEHDLAHAAVFDRGTQQLELALALIEDNLVEL